MQDLNMVCIKNKCDYPSRAIAAETKCAKLQSENDRLRKVEYGAMVVKAHLLKLDCRWLTIEKPFTDKMFKALEYDIKDKMND